MVFKPETNESLDGTTHNSDSSQHEVLIVGAGFAGIYLLYKLRNAGFDCKILEAGDDIGGTWCHNTYPGSRTDTRQPYYQLSIPEVYEVSGFSVKYQCEKKTLTVGAVLVQTWTWSEKYPDQAEMLRYFQHVDDMINVKRDVLFGMRVVDARFHNESQKWHVATQKGAVMASKFFIVAAGFASKPLTPTWDGIEQFEGELYHTYQWPSDVHLGRKRVALVGTGATGIQVAQQVAKEAASLTIFQRTPNFCLPMVQQKLDRKTQLQEVGSLQQKLDYRLTTFSGHPESFVDRSALDDTPEEREAFFESLWRTGGFAFWIATYKDILFDREANRFAYDFWVKKTRARIQGRDKQDILAPLDPPHPFGTRRPCLEVDFYEQVSRSHVSLVDINKTPILRIVKEGILTADGTMHGFDVISIATGFDALTGSLLHMGLHTSKGLPLHEKWAGGVSTYFGMTMAGFPNLFFLFSVHGPTASNGPACIELQGNWIAETLLKMRRDGVDSIEPTPEAERSWTKQIHETLEGTMIHETRSWYSGANNPGREREPLLFFGGFPSYQRQIHEALENDFRGFNKTFKHGR